MGIYTRKRLILGKGLFSALVPLNHDCMISETDFNIYGGEWKNESVVVFH